MASRSSLKIWAPQSLSNPWGAQATRPHNTQELACPSLAILALRFLTMLYCLLIQIKELLLIGSSCSGSVTLDFPNLLFSFLHYY